MNESALSSSCDTFDARTAGFYRRVMETLQAAQVPFLVGGAYAFSCYTDSPRQTKDLDLFIRREDYEQLSAVLGDTALSTELTFPHWLAKVYDGEVFIDIIFNSGNGMTKVDTDWFVHARDAEVLGMRVQITPMEETIWTKAFVMERERYDGADVAHMLRACASMLDWPRLLRRFASHWRVLLSHLVLFGFIYPAQRAQVPAWVMSELMQHLAEETNSPPPAHAVCHGTLLSREQYLYDIHRLGYTDMRQAPFGNMSGDEIAQWTHAIALGH